MPTAADRPTTKLATEDSIALEDAEESYEYRNKNIRRTMRRAMRYHDYSNNELSRRSGVNKDLIGDFLNGASNARLISTVEPMMRALGIKYYFRGKVSGSHIVILLHAAKAQGMKWVKAVELAGLTQEFAGQLKKGMVENPNLYPIQDIINVLKVQIVY